MTFPIWNDEDPVPNQWLGGVVTLGNFDGVHRGHHRLVAAVRRLARHLNRPGIVLCLDPHPATLLRPESPIPSLMTPSRKVEVLKAAGADDIILMRTTPSLLALEAEEFFDRVFVRQLQIKGLVEGEDFRFGRNRTGDQRLLETMCGAKGIVFESLPLAERLGERISSTGMRESLAKGRVEDVRKQTGRPYRLSGVISHGDGRGRALGFPTANMTEIRVMIPREGVYMGWASTGGQTFKAAVNIGPNPTFGIQSHKVEVHLLDCERDLYGETLDLDLFHRLRAVRAFGSVDELRTQIERDVAAVREWTESDEFGSIHRELATTITEFVRLETEASLQPLGGRLDRAEFKTQDELALSWVLPKMMPPHLGMDLALHLEERIRAAFPEVAFVTHQTLTDD